MSTIDAVILTKSIKDNGFCVVGLDIYSGKWVRFVSDEKGAPLLSFQTQYQNVEGFCAPLDVVRAEVIAEVPFRNHTEDCKINCQTLMKRGYAYIEHVIKKHPPEKHDYVFGNDESSLATIDGLTYSLMFIQVNNLTLNPSANSCKADFHYDGRHYQNMSITDPDYVRDGKASGIPWIFDNAYIVVSMPCTPYYRDGRYHKFIAKIFQS